MFPQIVEINGLIFQGNGVPLYIGDNVHRAVDLHFLVEQKLISGDDFFFDLLQGYQLQQKVNGLQTYDL